MTENIKILNAMIEYFASDPKRINHLIKVYSYASIICENENIDLESKIIIEIASIVHDIGIKKSEEKYGSSSGKYQEIEGPPEAEALLGRLGIEPLVIERCCWLIANHHTYGNITDIDHQILVEADFLVNAYEDDMSQASIQAVKKKIFKTSSGIELLETIFQL